MKLGIIGLDRSGKTTVFNALTGADKEAGAFGKIEAHISIVRVPDERIDWLSGLYNPKKTVYATIEFVDIPGNINDSSDPKIVAVAREVDALVFVIRDFHNDNVPHPLNSIDPLRDLEQIKTGLIIADMSIAEKRLEKLQKIVSKGAGTEQDKTELSALKKVLDLLMAEKNASEAELTEQEEKSVRSFQFLTMKPVLTLLNISDDAADTPRTSELLTGLANSMAMSANIEAEIRRLDEADRQAFLDDIGIKELSLNSFIRKAYSTLGLISFFTVGEDEVRAWTINSATPAVKAAGKIHSDLERGFIRAEVFSYDDIRGLGSEREVKSSGKFRLEGKDYIVKDGDIVSIKFSV
ncbi:MAG: redox-regulated ATPase YchF [Candidatus Omnitrophica bacterium]|nr:redox-regulated ATPase YchF [Candidatus Omnitrophota bacterium]MDD5488242.1 redox-regulated ATPase YchF [Candidatus Omnitrophota bacterium]